MARPPACRVPSEPFAQAEVVRLEEMRLLAIEDRVDAELALRRYARLAAELEGLVDQHPLRERLWRQLMLALYGAGRQAEALATYRRAHQAFAEELGIEPGPELKDLQRAILVQDPRLGSTRVEPADLLARAAPLLPSRTYTERAESLYAYGVALWRLGERERARGVLEQALEEAISSRDPGVRELIRVTLAADLCERGEIGRDEWLGTTQRAIAVVDGETNDRTMAKLRSEVGVALRDTGRAEESVDELERSLELSIASGDSGQEGWTRNQLAISLTLGPVSVRDALAHCESHLAALEWGRPGPLGIWASLAVLHAQLADDDTAARFARRAVEAAHSSGVLVELAWIQRFVATSLEATGDDSGAEAGLRSGLEILAATQGTVALSAGLNADLARLLARTRDADEARVLLESARAAVREDAILDRMAVLQAASLVNAAQGFTAEAADEAAEAVRLARTTDFPHLLAGALETLAALARQPDALAEAASIYTKKGNIAAVDRLLRNQTPE